MTDHVAVLDAILEQTKAAGFVEIDTDGHGQQIIRLTADGVQVARQLAMIDEDG
jgi:hypothetical protein